ncbi:hypothetical protein Ahia01_000280900 [Argonauta hians]
MTNTKEENFADQRTQRTEENAAPTRQDRSGRMGGGARRRPFTIEAGCRDHFTPENIRSRNDMKVSPYVPDHKKKKKNFRGNVWNSDLFYSLHYGIEMITAFG